ncbi:hypothetical protein EDB81DRAFT_339182 [Dactylonectria macrodidyma]|uniref:C2H2-type domain-containing protein n=1 Tax=Dactylonectria macrodidyma TaxID=307937 RepID=A0A9P9FEB5_9HYPO|nr:hypothetical protein EDB81DRAFT_339182 [Dactylonectria macrodidyma]
MHTAAASFMSSQYAIQQGAHSVSHQHPQPPPSPPMDDYKCSLPSISNLLGLADGGSPVSETSPVSRQHSPQLEAGLQQQQQQQRPETIKAESRPGSGYAKSSQQRGLPPTPPMSTDASFDGYNSPSNKSINQVYPNSAPRGYYYETTPPLEADIQRQVMASGVVPRSTAPPVQASYSQQSFAAAYVQQPPMGTYYPPMQPTPPPQTQVMGAYYQRSLPQTFPPPMTMAAPCASGANPWQHHHYLNPTGGAAFPQSQDRYICQTCSKAFSRPSSLRIHSHSHTGEKPFKCPHAGCGKAFSVRSNMKRHERGCHSFEFNASASVLRS